MKKSEEEIRSRVIGGLSMEHAITETKLLSTISEEVLSESREDYIRLRERKQVRRNVFNSIRRLDVLQDLLEDEEITEIMVNGATGFLLKKAES